MFVRWKRKRRKDTSHFERPDPNARAVRVFTPEYLLSASLVESFRNAEGKPRQRTVVYLGSIRECKLDPDNRSGIFHRGYFWRDAAARLAELELSKVEQAQIVEVLKAKVPQPDPDEHQQAVEESEERIRRVMATAGTA